MAASSSVGFQPGHVFVIRNAKDKTCAEIADRSVEPGAKVITQKAKRDDESQKFKTDPIEDAPGEYRVSAVLQPPDASLVWDYVPDDGLVIHNTASCSPSQIWQTERVYAGRKICYIKTQDGLCLKNMGKGKQLTLVPKNPKDVCQHWELVPTTSF